jgi:putative transposase
MKKTRFTETQIIPALKNQEDGISTREIYRELGVTEATFYIWRLSTFVSFPEDRPFRS